MVDEDEHRTKKMSNIWVGLFGSIFPGRVFRVVLYLILKLRRCFHQPPNFNKWA